MKYHVLTMVSFQDIHTKETYEANKELVVSEERALELFSSKNHLVRFLSRENINLQDSKESEKSITQEDNIETPESESNLNNNNISDNYDSLNFKELEALAIERNLDIVGANSKEKLRELLRNNS